MDIPVKVTPFRTKDSNRPCLELDIMGLKICVASHDMKLAHEAAKAVERNDR